ncbi:hypothetical protein MASR2M29_21680 [Spirochaetota bacterium]
MAGLEGKGLPVKSLPKAGSRPIKAAGIRDKGPLSAQAAAIKGRALAPRGAPKWDLLGGREGPRAAIREVLQEDPRGAPKGEPRGEPRGDKPGRARIRGARLPMVQASEQEGRATAAKDPERAREPGKAPIRQSREDLLREAAPLAGPDLEAGRVLMAELVPPRLLQHQSALTKRALPNVL